MAADDLTEEEKRKAELMNIDFEKIEEATEEALQSFKKHDLNFRESVIGLHKLHGDLNEAFAEELN